MIKKLIKFLFYFSIILILVISYLSFFGLNTERLNDKIKANYFINQKSLALFVTDIFNLIKKSSLKI